MRQIAPEACENKMATFWVAVLTATVLIGTKVISRCLMSETKVIAEGVTLRDGWISGLGAEFFRASAQTREYAQNGLPKAELVELTPAQIEALQHRATHPAE